MNSWSWSSGAILHAIHAEHPDAALVSLRRCSAYARLEAASMRTQQNQLRSAEQREAVKFGSSADYGWIVGPLPLPPPLPLPLPPGAAEIGAAVIKNDTQQNSDRDQSCARPLHGHAV